MRKTIAQLIAVSLVALATISLALAPVWAQEGGFRESFDAPRLEGWEHSPDVLVVDGVLRVPPGNFALRFGDWSEPTLDLRLRRAAPGEVLVQYHFRDESGYVVHILQDVVVLVRRTPEAPSELGQAPLEGGRSGDWMDLQIAVRDGQHTISLNGQSLITASDPDPLPSGAILLQAMGEGTAEFDDLALSAQPAPPPQPAPPAGEPTPVPAEPAAGTDQGDHLWSELLASQVGATEVGAFLINILLAVVTSYVLGRVYVHWGSSLSNRRRFAANFMLMTVTTTFIILVVRSSVALSLGLVGALSIVRFRTAIKEPEELAYLFFAIGLGIGLGDNQRLITLLAFAATIVILGLAKLFRRAQADVNLHMTVASRSPRKVDMEEVFAALKPHCQKLKLLRFDENDDVLEMAFLVEFKRMANLSAAKTAIRGLADSVDVTFLDNKGVW